MSPKNPARRIHWRRVFLGTLLLVLAWPLSLAAEILAYSSKTHDSPAEAAIVLGAGVQDERPTPVFEERIKHGVSLYKTNQVNVIIFTGGIGRGDQLAESEVAREYAIQAGVPAEDIYCETSSKITYENLEEAKKILDRQGLTKALIVSDPLHMKRAVTMARDLGIDAQPSPTPTSRYVTWKSKSGFLFREIYFYTTYLLTQLLLGSR